MAPEDEFPFRESPWHQNDELSKGWLKALESTGPENVRAVLAQTDASSRGAISVGIVRVMTIGFAQEWLAWNDKRKSEREAGFRASQIYWTRWAAISASCAVAVGVVGWAVTIALRGH
jgi:hypothetical protein